ncbi:HTH-type transcriptional regulator CymR [compost metagenome]
MLSNTAEYALRAVHFLARRPQESRTIQQIAQDTQVPADYLSKVMQGLARAGVVASQRGKHGGFRMARPVETLTLYDITEAVSPTQVLDRCPRNRPDHAEKLCALHECCRQAALAFNRRLQETRLVDVLEGGYLDGDFAPAAPADGEARAAWPALP